MILKSKLGLLLDISDLMIKKWHELFSTKATYWDLLIKSFLILILALFI